MIFGIASYTGRETTGGALGNGLVARLRVGGGKISLGKLSLPLDTLRQGGWMLVATVVTGVSNYLSNVFVGRMLGPADYGIFTSLLSFSIIAGAFAGVVQTAVTYFVARLRGKGNTAEIGALLVYLLKRLLLWGAVGAAVLSLCSKPLGTFLQISPLSITITCLSLIPTAVLPVVNGALGGLQRFGALGGVQISTAVFRLVAVAGLITLRLGVIGAVASLPLSSLAAFVLGMFFLGDVLRRREEAGERGTDGLLGYSINVALVTVCFAVLTYGDVIMVKSRFPPAEAGLYSAVATLGKLNLFPSVVATLLMPKATEQHARGRSTTGLVRKSLLAVGLLCGGITIAFFLFATPIVGTFFGEQYLAFASLLGLYAFAMMLYSLVNVWLIYYLAINEKRYAYVLLIGSVLLIALLALFASDLAQVVVILVGVGIVQYLGGELLLLIGKWRSS
jgi:O-antigen/teichoic acid export membrane protein